MTTDNISAATSFLQVYPNARLFPAIWDTSKKQHKPLTKWGREYKENSNTVPQLEQWQRDFGNRGVYYCVAAEQSGITIIDVDDKKGKTGSRSLKTLQEQNGRLPETLTSQTPSGGWHFFFKGACKTKAESLGSGLDTPVMVPVPGSITQKGVYQIHRWTWIASLPEYIPAIAGKQKEQAPNRLTPLIEAEDPIAINMAVQYLQSQAPEAHEGNHGDQTTCDVARVLHDIGVYPDKALELMYNHWNFEKAFPPWTPGDLKTKIFSSYQSCNDPVGCKHPTIEFKNVTFNDELQAPFTCAADMPEDYSVEWLVKKYIEVGSLNLFFGEHSSYKSFLTLDLAAAVALGQPWGGRPTKQGAVFYFAGEGRRGINRRTGAIKKQRCWQKGSPFPLYFNNKPIRLDIDAGTRALIQDVHTMCTQTRENPRLMVFDTLATSIGTGDENDTKGMTTFLHMINHIQKTFPSAAIIIVHHTGQENKKRARGSYVLPAGMDSVYRIYKDGDRAVCLERPMKLKDGDPLPDTWFEMHSHVLGKDEDGENVTSLSVEFNPFYEPDKDDEIEIKPPRSKKQQAVLSLFLDGEGRTLQRIKEDMIRNFKHLIKDSTGRARFHDLNKSVDSLVGSGHLILEGDVYHRTDVNHGVLQMGCAVGEEEF